MKGWCIMDEKAAVQEWKEYYNAIKEHELDNISEYYGHIVNYMYDAFFTGFYAGRDYQKDKENE